MSGARKVHIKSFGCQMNVYDSHRMADMLAPEGFDRDRDARGRRPRHPQHLPHPREGGREGLFRARPHPRAQAGRGASEGRQMTVAVAGCVAQAEGEEIIRRAPAVDLVVGPQSYHRLPGLLARAAQGERAIDTEFPARGQVRRLAAPTREATRARGVTAFVTVQEGCDKFCTFCVVPYTRGIEVSRPVAQDRRRGRAPRRGRRARGDADRPERQRLSRRRSRTAGRGRSAACCTASPTCRASRGCATPRAIRATWTTA